MYALSFYRLFWKTCLCHETWSCRSPYLCFKLIWWWSVLKTPTRVGNVLLVQLQGFVLAGLRKLSGLRGQQNNYQNSVLFNVFCFSVQQKVCLALAFHVFSELNNTYLSCRNPQPYGVADFCMVNTYI